MNKKGFTLVELLAVIVILSIIAIITIPMIKGVIDKVKLGSLEDSVYGLKSAAELYYSSNEKVETTEFICNDNGCLSDTGKKLDYKGKVEGKIKLFSDGKVSICLTSDNYASSILANEKKATTKMGGCDEETYEISEVIAIEKYNKVNSDYESLKNTLYNKTLITNVDNDISKLNEEINSLDLNKTSYEIYEDGNRVSGYPDGSYNVDVQCDGATGKWNNTFKGVILSNVNNENIKCKINFITCTTGTCDTSTIAWVNWVTLLGYNPENYTNLNDFLSKEITISSCVDIEKIYNNDNGAYDYLKTQTSLIKQINDTVNFSTCNIGFNYTGTVQEYDVKLPGIYKLEVYGAQGGYSGGKGGYSSGYKKFLKQDKLYVCIGGIGNDFPYTSVKISARTVQGGYNGGGNLGYNGSYEVGGGSGGGATHISIENGILSKIGESNKSKVYIVAGGGGGGITWHGTKAGGSGGGTTGGNGILLSNEDGSTAGIAGTQTSGGKSISEFSGGGSFGQGGSGSSANGINAGGGGGWYGGGASRNGASGAGGSGYIGGVPTLTLNGTTYSPTTTSGVRSGNGYAKITFVGIY